MIELRIIYRMLVVDLSVFNKFKANMGHGYTSFAITTKISFIKFTITDVLSYKVVCKVFLSEGFKKLHNLLISSFNGSFI